MEQQTEIQVSTSAILADLRAGLTRTSKDKYYDAALGCIKDKYNLTGAQMKELFKTATLKGKKTAGAIEASKNAVRTKSNKPVLVIVDDLATEVENEVEAEA